MSSNAGQWRLMFWQEDPSTLRSLDVAEGGPCLLRAPAGLGVPGRVSADGATVERDGVEMYTDVFSPRDVTFSLLYPNGDCGGCDSRMELTGDLGQWARSCGSAALVVSPDCADLTETVLEGILADPQERVLIGPYIIHGKTRAARVVHERSNRGLSRVDYRFQGDDHRIGVLQPTGPGETPSEMTCLTLTPDGTPQDAPNWGDLRSYPVVRLVGDLTTPVEIHQQAFSPVTVDGSNITAGTEVIVDFARRRAWVDGTDTDRTLDVTWGWRSLVAEGDFQDDVWLSTGSPGDTGHAEFCYGTYVVGI